MMIKQLLDFLTELKQDNRREWFQANKARYDALKRAHASLVGQLIDRIALFDEEMAPVEASDCLFRIYRDVRFSSDKRPYKTHVGAYIASQGGKNSQRAGYYLHLEPGACFFGGGLWMPPPKLLKTVRQDIYDHIDEFLAIIERPSFHALYPTLDGETLKRMPAGFPETFRRGDILRHKDFFVSASRPDSFFYADADLADRIAVCLKELLPFNRFLNYAVDTSAGRPF
jgi:uncharacterized protein (TIGR02453 family)